MSVNIPIIDIFTKIDELMKELNKRIESLTRALYAIYGVGEYDIVREINRVENISVGTGITNILFADISKYKTKTLTIKVASPMKVYVYLYDREKDLDYSDIYKVFDYNDLLEYKTVTFTFTDLYKFIRVCSYTDSGGEVLLCSIKGSVNWCI